MPQTDVTPTSASIASTGLGIRYIGNHCYAFSAVVASASLQSVFDFTSGSGFIVASLTLTPPIRMTSGGVTDGFYRGYDLAFNSQTVLRTKLESDNEDMPTLLEAQILIPPFTAVVLTCIDNGNSTDYVGTANITGRVYGAE